MRALIKAAALAAIMGAAGSVSGAAAEPQTLADMRAELSQLASDLQSLRAELVASGPVGIKAAGGVAALDRMNAMETQIAALTGQVEALQNRVEKIVADGTNRIGDLEFRLCEMEEGCDISALTEVAPLGGAAPMPHVAPAATPPAAAHLAPPATLQEGEQAELDRAREVLGRGDFRRAADLFAAFAETYPNGPLTSQARYDLGRALNGAGERRAAAEAWLEAFASAPDGPVAGQSLLALGEVLGTLDQTSEACTTLAEAAARFGAEIGDQAAVHMTRLSCSDFVTGEGAE